MNYADIKEYDVANGPGIRVSIFVSGCNHACPGCFNQEAWDFNYGNPFTQKEFDFILDKLSFEHYKGISFLGGEPFEYVNQEGLLPLAKAIKEKYPEKTIWCYTGFSFDTDILEKMCPKWPLTQEFLSYIDVIVDGKFIEAKKDLNLKFRGSSNQRIILVKESLEKGEIVLWQ
ncbi:MAG: anaerobic ribonucleoside-triphosphate reductase activating protein [Lachnospiraceae bacterium]|nr:anaerobic ribonucleoside-triphosphate reductase activating protein [Lachnospiraceae bacterium]